jgi:hypothetical protein
VCYVSSCGKGTDHYTQNRGKEGKKLALVDTVMWSTLLHRVTKESQKSSHRQILAEIYITYSSYIHMQEAMTQYQVVGSQKKEKKVFTYKTGVV